MYRIQVPEEKRKGKRKKVISVQMEDIVVFLEELSVYRACSAYWQTVSSRMDYWVAAGTVDLIVGPMTGNISFCRSEEHTSELQSQSTISYAVFCLKKKKNNM